MRFDLKIPCVFILLIVSCMLDLPSYSQVYLTEIMFDPLEDENIYEFVEIWNRGIDSVDIAGWRLGDGVGDDEIITAEESSVLPGGWFGLILDPDYFNNVRLYDSLIGDNCVILTVTSSALGDHGLKNTEAETVLIYNNQAEIIAAYQYTVGNEPGYSEEKIMLDGEDIPANWQDSRSLYGSPGTINTVSPDSLNLSVISLTYNPAMPVSGNAICLTAMIKNTGLRDFPACSLGFFLDNEDSILMPEEIFDLIACESFQSSEEKEYQSTTGTLSAGCYSFAAKIMTVDDDSTDDLAFREIYITAGTNSLIFNEVMFKPNSGEPEWVEIYNNTNMEIPLEGWTFSEADSSDKLSIGGVIISGNGMLVLAEDSAIIQLFDLPAAADLAVISGWNALNNAGDTLYLFDPYGNIIDQLAYPADWGTGEYGVSWERISPWSTEWFPSVDEAGGTPGRQNSVYFPANIKNTAQLTIVPQVFSPDGDGIDDYAEIKVRLPVPYARINLRIFDTNGRLVKFLARNELAGNYSSFFWQGDWEDGKSGRIGAYIVHLEAISEPYKEKYEVKKVVVLAGKL